MSTTKLKPRKRGANISTLTDQQQAFVEYLTADKNFNVTEAARQAGYAQPASKGGQLLKQPKIAAYLGNLIKQRKERLEIQSDDVLRELLPMAFFDIADMFDEDGVLKESIHDIPPGARKMIGGIKQRVLYDRQGNVSGVETEFKINNKLNAIELVMKHLGMFEVDSGKDEDDREPWDYSMYETDTQPRDIVEDIIAAVGSKKKKRQKKIAGK